MTLFLLGAAAGAAITIGVLLAIAWYVLGDAAEKARCRYYFGSEPK